MPSNKSVTLLPALLREHLPNTIIPTSDPNDPLNRIGTLLQEANRQQSAGHFRDAELSISEARRLAQGHTQALAEIDFFCALSLLEQHKGDEGIQSLSAVLIQHRAWFNTPEGQGSLRVAASPASVFSYTSRKERGARPLLEEAVAFQLDIEVRSDVHCHLGRCYHELSLHTLAREQFERANAVGVSEEWQPAFHYYYGYTLYDLREFQLAKREFIRCLQSGASGPEEWMRYAMLAATSRKLGEHSEARAYDEKATSLKP